MRTKTLLLTAALGAAGIITSLAQDPGAPVYSVNAVGYVNKTLVAGFSLISNPLNVGDNTIAEVLPTLSADGEFTTVFVINPDTGAFDSSIYDGVEWTNPTMAMPPGVGVFVNSLADHVVTFVGEVPQGQLNNDFGPGLSLLASIVPQAGDLQADLGMSPGEFDTVFTWDPERQDYDSSIWDGAAWTDAAAATVDVAEGFYISSLAGGTWDRNFSVND